MDNRGTLLAVILSASLGALVGYEVDSFSPTPTLKGHERFSRECSAISPPSSSATNDYGVYQQELEKYRRGKENHNKEKSTNIQAREYPEIRSFQEFSQREIWKYQEKKISIFREFLENSKHQSPSEIVSDQYQKEPIDYDWAQEQRTMIMGIIEGAENSLSNVTPLNVNCRSKNCQIVVADNGDGSNNKLFDDFTKSAESIYSESDSSFLSTYFYDHNRGELVIYLSEEGDSSLFNLPSANQ
ncbi:hypothetical protein [Marinimicrobium sp. ARAG 43.8]|uniref:hypothetical protein n=1 Tax=Marinimicrobium sp. ARAG 43.8 TaxID=3418719 RepID=UPI003CF5A292